MTRPFVKNAADVQQVTNARRLEKDLAAQRHDDLVAVLATGAGQRVLWRILDERCHAFATCFDPGGSDSKTNFNAGRQDVGHWLLAEITTARPEALIEMMRAHHQEIHG